MPSAVSDLEAPHPHSLGVAQTLSGWRLFDDSVDRFGTTHPIPHPRQPHMSLVTLDGSPHRGCGGRYALQTETVTIRVSGMAAVVEREFYRCNKCEYENRTIEQRDVAERTAIERIRAEYTLLAPKAIRQLRESLGLKVPQLAELCYGTPQGIVEGWEKGRYLQNRQADALLRSLADPETLEHRAAKAGMLLHTPDTVLDTANATA